MRHAIACLLAAAGFLSMPTAAQTFVNLDFDSATQPLSPDPFLEWSDAIPGWGHSEGDSTEHVYYLEGHLGFSQSYILLDVEHSPFGAASGAYAVRMRSGAIDEQNPHAGSAATFLSQTGHVPVQAQWVSLLATSFMFELTLDGTRIGMLPVGLDPASPTYPDDLLTYAGEWRGDVSAFAGQVVELKITNLFPIDNGFSPDFLTIDEISFQPVPEASTASLVGLGMIAMLLVARHNAGGRRRRTSPHDPHDTDPR